MQRIEHVDLQHVVVFDVIRRQRHQLEHFDLDDVGRLDPIGRQRPHGHLPSAAASVAAPDILVHCRKHRACDNRYRRLLVSRGRQNSIRSFML